MKQLLYTVLITLLLCRKGTVATVTMNPLFRILHSRYVCFIFFSLCYSKLNGQIVTTICGDGTYFKYSGDGGLVIKAQINWPFNVITDLNGNIYFVDFNNFCIRRIDAKII